jgi:hypothetical protein
LKKIILIIALSLGACNTTKDGIRYDDSAGVPPGYEDLCKREPEAAECGGKQP